LEEVERKVKKYIKLGIFEKKGGKMKKLRNLLVLVVVALVGLFAVGCGGKDTSAQDREALESVLGLLNVRFEEDGDTLRSVTGNLVLDTTFDDATIEWASSNPNVIAVDGTVTRGDESVDVTLTATIKVGKQSDIKTFRVHVLGLVYEVYTVTFDAGTGRPTPEVQNVREGKTAVLPDVEPERDRYAFEGWYLDGNKFNFNTPIEENTSLVAKWELVEPIVSFNLGYTGANPIAPQRLHINTTANEPTAPTRDRYQFAGWTLDEQPYDFNEPVTEDLVLTATWTQLQAQVSFDLGYGNNHPADQIKDIGEKAEEPIVEERDRFEFVGWYLGDDEYDFEEALVGDVHLVAKWNQLVAIVTFDLGFGEEHPAPVTLDVGGTVDEPTEVERPGYNFIGWLDGSTLYNFENPVYRDLNLVAGWTVAGEEISATIIGPDAITHYVGAREFNPVGEYVAIDNLTGAEYELIVISGFYHPNYPNTYTYTIGVLLDQAITKEVKLTVKPAVAIPNELSRNQIQITLWHANGTTIENKLIQYAQEFEELMLSQGYNIKVNITKNGSGYDELRTNVINAIKGAELPNLVQNYPDHVVEYHDNGVIESLTPYIYHPVHGLDPNNPNERLEDIVRSYREENRDNNLIGDYLSLPFNKSTEVAVYNKTFFDAVLGGRSFPETWQGLFALVDDILAIKNDQIDAIAANWAASGEALSAQDIQKAKDQFVPFTYDSQANSFITLTRQFGGQYTSRNPETGKGKVEFINPNTIRMLKFFAEDRGRTFTVPQFWGVDYANNVSFHGTTIFSVGSTAGLRYNNAVNKGFKLYEVGVAPVPYDSQNPSSRAVIQQGTNISLTNRGTADQKLASWLFLKYLTSTNVQADFGIATGYTPVRLSAIQTAEYQEFLQTADTVLGDSASAMSLTATQYKDLAERKLVAMGARVAAQQTAFSFYDEAFIGSSKAREEVGNAFERVMLSTGTNIDEIINNALQAAKEATERVIT